jgi:polysaccharide pyruvyl transferase WcaK-like protein
MYIEIRGAEFANKGAELMLRAVMAQVHARMPAAKIVLAPSDRLPYEQRARLGAYQKLAFSRLGTPTSDRLGRLMPRKFRRYYGLVMPSEIEVLLDASGFAYGDQWGAKPTITTSRVFAHSKMLGSRIIMLPQAFGPFTSASIRDAVKRVVNHVDLMFPRDDASYEHLVSVVGARPNIVKAPDFTNLIEGTVPATNELDSWACIIPNARMVEKAAADRRARYLPFLKAAVQSVIQHGGRPFILLHAEQDYELATKLADAFDIEIPIVAEMDPLRMKGLIGRSGLVISSRFHGLVSALSQGVPALSAGWSHKYEMLFRDYGFPEGIIDVLAEPAEIEAKVGHLIEQAAAIRTHLSAAALAEKERSRAMWEKVFQCVGA